MKIVCPYTRLRQETVEALRAHAGPEHDIHFVDVSEHDEQLWELWRDLWAAREDVLVVEHDIVLHADVIPQLIACPEPWCTFGYRYAHFGVYHGTGCIRIRGSLMAKYPLVIEHAGMLEGPLHPPRHWCSLDAYMQHELHRVGCEQHRHEPPVEHLGTGVSHGCIAAPVAV